MGRRGREEVVNYNHTTILTQNNPTNVCLTSNATVLSKRKFKSKKKKKVEDFENGESV